MSWGRWKGTSSGRAGDQYLPAGIIGGSKSGKTNALLNLINYQRPGDDNIYLYVKDPFE